MTSDLRAPLALALNIADTASALSVSKGTIYTLVREGKLRLLKVGRRSLIPTKDVEAFLESLAS